MTEEKDYSKILPTEPPEGMVKYLKSKGKLNCEGIVYRSAYIFNPLTGGKEKMIECTCSACGETFYQEYSPVNRCNRYAPAPFGFINSSTDEHVISGEETLCPMCGEEVRLHHIGNMKTSKTIESCFAMSVHMIEGKLALIGWYFDKRINRIGKTDIVSKMYEAYVFEGRKAIRLVGYRRYMSSISFFSGWEQLKRCSDEWGQQYKDDVYPWEPSILNGTEFENCKLDLYMKIKEMYPITYMRIWQKHRNVENIIMQGAGNILNDMIEKTEANNYRYYGQKKRVTTNIADVNWKKNRPSEMLGLNREEFRNAVKYNWGLKEVDFYKKAKAHNISPADISVCKKYGYSLVEMLFAVDNSIMRTLRYLEKQKKKYPTQAKKTDISCIMDYWNMAKDNGAELSDSRMKYPQNLVTAHDTELRKKKWKTDKKLMELFEQRYEQLSKFCYSNDLFEIHPAMNENEMILEGKILNHCVAGYAASHAKGKTAIFFIRKIENLQEPYFTLELDEKNIKVRQNRGYCNCGKTSDVQAFEDEWIEFVKNTVREDKKNGKSNHTAA